MTAISPSLAKRIQRRIGQVDTFGMANWVARVWKEKLNALPLQANGAYQWALRADGAVLRLDLDSASLPFDQESNPVIRYAVLFEAARRYPELRELEPARPAGVQQCATCDGRGWMEAARTSCVTCLGVGWHMRHRPVAEWLERIDRGDRLELRAEDGAERLVAARLAGMYVARGDGLELWSAPAAAQGRRRLDDHLRKFAVSFASAPPYQRPVAATWQPNPTPAADPFDSTEHSLRFHGTGSGGSYEVDFARHPGGRCTMAVTLNHDGDPLGGAMPVTETTELDEGAARVRIESEMRGSGRSNPFPAIIPRTTPRPSV